MLWTIFVVLLILWLFGLISGYTMGGIIHILLVIAIVVILIQIFRVEDDCSHLDPFRRR